MAKGRTHKAHRAERLLGSLAQPGPTVLEPDLEEDDIWYSQAFSGGHDAFGRVPPERGVRDVSRARRRATAAHDHRQVGGLSLAFEDGYDAAHVTVVHQYRNVDPAAAGSRGRSGGAAASSAPVNVPFWPSYLQVDATQAGALDADDDGDGDDEWLPPHEYLAREHRNSTMATSVFEGVGRTLKGRDMSRVRDAVWSRTGFFG